MDTLHSFPVAAMTNNFKFSDTKTTDLLFYSSGGRKAKMGMMELKLRFPQSCIPLGDLG